MRTILLPTPADTHAFGIRLAGAAFPGAVLALAGELGAGKTALVRGVGEGLGVSSRVQSPTFVLVQAHEGRLPLWHADAYRLGGPDELDELGLAELARDGVLALEWADRFLDRLPADRLEIRLVEVAAGREATVRATGPLHAPLEAAL